MDQKTSEEDFVQTEEKNAEQQQNKREMTEDEQKEIVSEDDRIKITAVGGGFIGPEPPVEAVEKNLLDPHSDDDSEEDEDDKELRKAQSVGGNPKRNPILCEEIQEDDDDEKSSPKKIPRCLTNNCSNPVDQSNDGIRKCASRRHFTNKN